MHLMGYSTEGRGGKERGRKGSIWVVEVGNVKGVFVVCVL